MSHEFCRTLLAQVRTEARDSSVALPKRMRGCLGGVRTAPTTTDPWLSSCGWWEVYSDQQIIWQGSACCAYEARARAIGNILDRFRT